MFAIDFFAPFANLLAWLYSIWPSYAGMIVLYTLIIMLLVTPLTLKGTRSMMVLQSLQPEMKKIQAQYKDDRQKLNEEMLRFYRENNINPLGGCLPLLIQLPVFLVLYRVLKGLTTTGTCTTSDGVTHTGGFHPQYIKQSSDLFQSLCGKTTMNSWGMDLARSAVSVVGDNLVKGLPYLLLVVGVAITSYLQQRQISGRNPAAASNPQQQMLMRIGPIMITFFSLIVVSGLAIYFFVSNLYRCGQQALISKTIYSTPEAKKLMEQQRIAAEEAKTKPKKGFFESLLGDSRPQPTKKSQPTKKPPPGRASGNGKGGTSKGGTTKGSAGKASDKDSDGDTGTARPPSAKGNGGRTTPPKPRPATGPKKRKRK
jgi:YidC/Oxa1 family membrane protein insertase